MSHTLLSEIPIQYQEKAEEIRAYLVHVRGGAPFLSGADCRLLTTWLDENISVLAITTAIDRVAEKRREKRTRSRMSLNNCKGALNQILNKKEKTKKQSRTIQHIGILGLAEEITSLWIAPQISEYKRQLVSKLRELSEKDMDIQKKAELAIRYCRIFHEQVWEASVDQRDQLQSETETELESLQPLLGLQHWREMVEEVMRDKLRAQFPLISAQSIWNAINLSENENSSV